MYFICTLIGKVYFKHTFLNLGICQKVAIKIKVYLKYTFLNLGICKKISRENKVYFKYTFETNVRLSGQRVCNIL